MNTLPVQDQSAKRDPLATQEENPALLAFLRDEFQNLRASNAQHDLRIARLEDTINDLANDLKKLVTLWLSETKEDSPDGYMRRQALHGEDSVRSMMAEEAQGNWEYVIAQKGGYNDVLYTTVRELFGLQEDPVRFVAFLVQKREAEVNQQLDQLQSEYKKLRGSQLQEHFRDLWKSHYMLLKKKQARTWKEEIFLEAFDAFIAWLQD